MRAGPACIALTRFDTRHTDRPDRVRKTYKQSVRALEPGARADWIVLDPDHPALAEQTSATWLSSAVFCEHGETPVRDVFVGGERVIHERRHRDEARHYADYRRALAQLLADA